MNTSSKTFITPKEVGEAVKHYAPFLGLRDWKFKVEKNSPPLTYACAQCLPSIEAFKIGFNYKGFGALQDFIGVEDEWWDEFRRFIIHELIHVRLSPFVDAYEEKVKEMGGVDERDRFMRSIYNLEDAAVDRLAKTLRDYLPRYEPKGKRKNVRGVSNNRERQVERPVRSKPKAGSSTHVPVQSP